MARYDDLLDEEPPAPKRGWRSFVWRHLPAVTTSLLLALLMIVVLWPNVVITVPSGRVGVLWKRFNGFDIYCWCFVGRGTLLDPRELREEGLHIIAPWDRLFIYDLRLQSSSQSINAISKDGVNVTAQMNIRYQLAHRSVAVLHKFIGPKYLDTVVGPEIGSQAREVISKYTAEEVYTSRDAIQDQVRSSTQKSLGSNLNKLVQPEAMEQPDPKHYNDFLQGAIQILDTLVLSIELPPAIVNAINRQTEQFYLIQEYRFRVAREAEEFEAQADRGQWHRRVPADGQQGHFGFLSALARHRGHSDAGAVAEFEDHHHRRGQGRPADHPQRRDCGAGSDAAVRRERHAAAGGAGRPDRIGPGQSARRLERSGAAGQIIERQHAAGFRQDSGSAAFGRRNAFRCAGGAGRTEPQRSFRRRIDTFAD